MSKKFSSTVSDYLQWDACTKLIHRLYSDEKYHFSLYVALACFWGLRVSDLLRLKWSDIVNKDQITLMEKKTGKKRDISINPKLQLHIHECFDKIKPKSIDSPIFSFTVQYLNRFLKKIKTDYKLKIGNISSHTFRKSFGRKIYESSENSEFALVKLSEVFNHSSPSITRKYLGIKKEEIMEMYSSLTF